ncbi:MAG TPA: aldehyde dehydrogenase family protein, partial [Bacteroidetes bacterium]|nr:aldehyde dehydrogenase family protein [Bacteroidota bacterium]
FKAQLNNSYQGLRQDADAEVKAAEQSPYTAEGLGISYPVYSEPATYIAKAQGVYDSWRKTDVKTRAGILTESLDRIAKRFFEIAYATMHTTGQSFMMSFQASGPHSNDRALEAIALGVHEQSRFPDAVEWIKPMGRDKEGNPKFVKQLKMYRNVPMGISLCVGCSTFPVWNTSPAIYASLITGNPVIVKPHPTSIYAIAIVVEEIQRALQDAGFDANLIQLAVDTPEAPITKVLAENPAVKLIDYTGGNSFGNYLESLPGKRTFTEKAGINSIVLHSTDNVRNTMGNIAFSLSLYSGQMCTCPQNIFIPKDGIDTPTGKLSYEDTVKALTGSLKWLATHEKMGPGTLGAIQSPATFDRVKTAQSAGFKVLLESIEIKNPDFPKARIASPIVLEVPADNAEALGHEMFGPIVYIIPVDDYKHGVALARKLATEKGALTFSSWCTDVEAQAYMVDEMIQAYTSVSFNFSGPIWVNQSAGFSDFHVTGGNPAGNASLTDPEYVLGRFEIVGVRFHQ